MGTRLPLSGRSGRAAEVRLAEPATGRAGGRCALVLPVLLYFAYFLAPEEWSPGTGQLVRDPAADADVRVRLRGHRHCGRATLLDVLSQRHSGRAVQRAFGRILAAWWGLMLFWHVNWLWSVLPIPLALLLATRLRTANWLLERNTLRAWLLPGLVLAGSHRRAPDGRPALSRLPDSRRRPRLLVAEYDGPMTPEERATLDLYRARVFRNNARGRHDQESRRRRVDRGTFRSAATACRLWIDANQDESRWP